MLGYVHYFFQMPRTYTKKLGTYGKKNYNPIYMERAVAAVKANNMSMRQASEQFGVPYTTLNHRVNNKFSGTYGGQPALAIEVERVLVDGLQLCAEWGFPLKPTDVRHVVQQYLNKRGLNEKRFHNNLPGHEWFLGFMKRHQELTTKFAENTKRVRVAVSYESVAEYFNHLRVALGNIPPSNIINYDETNFVDDPGAAKVVLKRGTKRAFRALDASKTSTTVMFAIAADGSRLPPYVVYRAKHIYEGWKEGGIEGAVYNRSQRGWFDSTLFEDWFYSVVLPYFRQLEGDKVVIGDNLASHITLSVIQQCENNNIRFVLLPPNSTHMLQPLDVAYFRPLKALWRKNLETWKLRNRGVLPKTLFPRMLQKTIEDLGDRSTVNAMVGFRACGIVPFNPNAVLDKIKQRTEDTGQMETSWSDVLVERLDELKSGPSQAPKRGKKINIVAGKSITTNDVTSTPIMSSDKPKSKSRREVGDAEDSDPDSLRSEEEEILEEVGECSTSVPDHSSDALDVGDFVIVTFKTNKRDRLYVGKIEEISKNETTVNTMRKVPSEKDNVFVFPPNPDLCVVDQDQIQRKVNLKNARRGRHVFHLRNDEEENLQ